MQVIIQKGKAPADLWRTPPDVVLKKVYLNTSQEQRATKLAQLGLWHGSAQSPQHCSVQGGTKWWAAAWSHNSLLLLILALLSEGRNHGTIPVPDSANATSPSVFQFSYNGQHDMGTENRYFTSPPQPSSASGYRKLGHPMDTAASFLMQAAMLLHAYAPCLMACVFHHLSLNYCYT